jgi:hypothetical protein
MGAAWLSPRQYVSESQLKRGALKILWFKSPAEFRSWLKKNHADSHGIWLQSKGIEAYRKTWELFFDSNPSGKGSFKLRELKIIAGDG